jgi:hypothetical protein
MELELERQEQPPTDFAESSIAVDKRWALGGGSGSRLPDNISSQDMPAGTFSKAQEALTNLFKQIGESLTPAEDEVHQVKVGIRSVLGVNESTEASVLGEPLRLENRSITGVLQDRVKAWFAPFIHDSNNHVVFGTNEIVVIQQQENQATPKFTHIQLNPQGTQPALLETLHAVTENELGQVRATSQPITNEAEQTLRSVLGSGKEAS